MAQVLDTIGNTVLLKISKKQLAYLEDAGVIESMTGTKDLFWKEKIEDGLKDVMLGATIAINPNGEKITDEMLNKTLFSKSR